MQKGCKAFQEFMKEGGNASPLGVELVTHQREGP